jgi:RHS repeat-associated protein
LNTAGYTGTVWGQQNDIFVPADYDGDGKTDLAYWRPGAQGTFFVLKSTTGTLQTQNWGQTGDNPTVVGDYDGDGKADFAVYRPALAIGAQSWWYVLRSSDGTVTTMPWGTLLDQPSSGDFNGDGKADFVLRRGDASGLSTFYIQYSSGGWAAIPWGLRTDVIVPGDYDGDGVFDLAIVRPENGVIQWYARRSTDGGLSAMTWGLVGDTVTPGDYDADNKTDFAVWRPDPPATYYVHRSATSSVLSQPWGLPGDYPIANIYASAQDFPDDVVTKAHEEPFDHQNVNRPFWVRGWAIDQAAGPATTGVDAVEVFAAPLAQPPISLGLATYGLSRPNVGAQYGQRFTNSGYELQVTEARLPTPGIYTIYAVAHSEVSGTWDEFPLGVLVFVDMPTQTLTVTVAGTGQGTVTSDPVGINCSGPATPGGTCAYAFPWATTVTLTTTVTTGSFVGWSGGVPPPDPCAGDGACVRVMDHADAVTATFSTRPPLFTTYYHTDALGSVRLVTDHARNVLAHHDYQPFGEDAQPVAGDPRRFTGKELDVETALTYFGARYYRQTWGRFSTVDPVLDTARAIRAPQDWNRYDYVNNNPLARIDPDGRQDVAYRCAICPAMLQANAALRDKVAQWFGANDPNQPVLMKIAEGAADLLLGIFMPRSADELSSAVMGSAVAPLGAFSSRVSIHHIATDKNVISTAAGDPFTPKFEAIFEKAGMTLQDVLNKVPVLGHYGPHPQYNRAVFERLAEALSGLSGAKYREVLERELSWIGEQTMTPGTVWNLLATGGG